MTNKNILTFKIFVSVAAIWYLAYKIDFSVLFSIFPLLYPEPILLVIMIGFVQIFLMGARWHLIQKQAFPEGSPAESLKYMWIGHFFSLVLPGGLLGGDFARGWYLKKKGGTLKSIGKILIEEKLFMLLSVLILSLPFFFIHFSFWIAGVFTTFVFVLCCIAIWHYFRVSQKFFILALSLLCVALSCLNAYILIHPFNSSLSFSSIAVVVPMTILIGSIPISFGGWGIREGAFVYFMGWVGLAKEPALSAGLALSFCALFLSLPGLCAWLKIKKKQERIEDQCVA